MSRPRIAASPVLGAADDDDCGVIKDEIGGNVYTSRDGISGTVETETFGSAGIFSGRTVEVDAVTGLKKSLIEFGGTDSEGKNFSRLGFLVPFALTMSTLSIPVLLLPLGIIHVRALTKLDGIVVEETEKLPEFCIVVACEIAK